MKKVVIEIDGIIREFNLETTSIEYIESVMKNARSFNIIEYKGAASNE